jgi:hypothetical protein
MLVLVHRVILLVALAPLGCVNDYLVRGSDTSTGTDTGSTSDTGSTTVEDPTTGGGMGDTTMGGMGDTTSPGMGDTGDAFTCEPCTADAECGDEWDLCVELDEIGPRCLYSCPEAGCPMELTCRDVLSIDGVAAMQCAPMNGVCAGDGTSSQ